MEIKADQVKELRNLTNAGMMEAKSALQEAGGDMEKAKAILKERGASIAEKKAEREAANGVVAAYIHMGNKIGVLVEVKVETDFVAKDEKFKEFANNIAMHIAGMSPKYLREEDIPAGELSKQDDRAAYAKEVALLKQPYVKDQSRTVEDYVNEQIAHFKENIQIGSFARFDLGSEKIVC
ncbi:MAG: translation elongation factor Ts [Patescibacteria group bacterium]|nr:translation elongation factor Ts [Patescibacteria group bacterium]